MKNSYFIAIILCLTTGIFSNLHAQNRYWISTTASNWNNTANWSTSSGGAGGASVPGSGNVAIFNGTGGRNGDCQLDMAPTVGGVTVNGYTGNVDINGNTLTTTGTNTFTTGTIKNTGASSSLVINSAGTTTFNGTTFNVPLTGSSGAILFSGSSFTGSVTLTKTNTTTDNGTGGNTFGSTVTLTNAATAALQMGGTNPDIFQGVLTLNVNSTGGFSIARIAAASQFNDNVVINYNDIGPVLFGASSGTSTLATGKTISIGSFGASGCGNLQLSYFTQVGGTTQSIVLGSGNNNALLTIGPSSTFNGTTTIEAPDLGLQTATFNGATTMIKDGTNTSNLRGGNVFASTLSVTNNGGDLVFGDGIADAGDTFNGTSTFTNQGGNRIRIAEQNAGTTFNAPATFTCLGSTDVNNRIQVSRLAGGQATFNSSATFISNGTASDIQISYDAGTSTTFNGPVYFTSSAVGGGDFFVGVNGDVIFNSDIEFNSTVSDPIYMNDGTGTVTFGNGTMSVGATGFSAGEIQFNKFTQTGTSTLNLTLTGTSIIRFGTGSTFKGAVNFIAPQIYLNGSTFNGTTYIEKNGATINTGNGGNTFNGTTTIVDSGANSIILGNSSADIFNAPLTLTNTGGATVYVAYNVAGTQLNDNVTVNCTSGSGIVFCNGSTATCSLASGKSMTVGASGFSVGSLKLQRFTQLGGGSQNLTLTGTAQITLGPSTTFGGNVNFIAPQFTMNGTVFNGTAYLEKTGATDNTGTGGDTFNGTTTIVNSGSGSFEFANTSPNIFNGNLTVNNTGTSRVQIGLSSAGNMFNGTVTINHGGNTTTNVNTIIARNAGCTATFNGTLTLNCTNTGGTGTGIIIGNDGSCTINANVIVSSSNGRGVLFGSSTGSVTLANGFTISTAGAGTFSKGTLTMKGLTQVGSTAQNLSLSGTADLTLGPNTTFNAAINYVAPQLYLNGTTFQGTAYLEKSGATDNYNNGGNVFNGTTTIVNSGSGALYSANSTLDTFNGQLTLTNSGSNYVFMAHNVPGTVFNDNVIVNSTAGGGVIFSNNSNGTATLASGKTISIGASGFSVGELRLRRFTQSGGTAQNLTLTGTGLIRVGPGTTFNGAVNFLAPRVILDGTTFNSTATLQKNGATSDDHVGGNTFNATTSITNTGSGRMRFATTTADVFNADVTFAQSGAGNLDVAYTQTNIFTNNITTNTNTALLSFGGGGGTIKLTGAGAQTISKSGSTSPTINNLNISKSSGDLTLNTAVTINTSATFVTGLVNTTSTNLLTFADNATVSGASSSSCVIGPVRKTGNDAFIFPTGKGTIYRAIAMSAPSLATDQFTAQYYNSAQGYGGSRDATLYGVSGCDYWTLDRTTGTSNVTVQLFFDNSNCGGAGYISNLSSLRVARFDAASSKWKDHGNGGTTGTTSAGSVITSAVVTSFSPFAVATADNLNALPIILGDFWLTNLNNSVKLDWFTYQEKNNNGFTIERSSPASPFQPIGSVKGAGQSTEEIDYSFTDVEPLPGWSYYRLKQTDFDGSTAYSKVISVYRDQEALTFGVYPNPVTEKYLYLSEPANVVITNSLNQVIWKGVNVKIIDVSALSAGIYIITNQNGQAVRFAKE